MKTILLKFLLLPTFLLIIACTALDEDFDKSIKTYEKKPQNYPDSLVLLSDATKIRYYQLGGTYQLSYKISEEYPAKVAISSISEQLKKMNWRPLPEDYLNPGLRSSHVRGWSLFKENDIKNRPRTTHQWLADWKNQNGDIVVYSFRCYQYRQYKTAGTKGLKDITVISIFIPAPLAEAQRGAAIADHKARNFERK